MPVILDLIMTQTVAQACPEHVLAVRFQAVTVQSEAGNPFPDGPIASSASQLGTLKAIEFRGHNVLNGPPVGFLKLPLGQGCASRLRIPADQSQPFLFPFLQSFVDLGLLFLLCSEP